MLRKAPFNQQAAGFTVIELIAVMVMLGVLAAIAAPGWLSFANRQRAIAARDQVLQELRATQSLAERTRQRQSLTLNPAIDPPTIASPNSAPQPLGDGRAGTIQLSTEVNQIYFDQFGNLVDAEGNPSEDVPFKIVVTSPPTSNGAKRCIFVETLMGAIRTENDAACN